jgi:hypothetical protein
MIRFKETVDLRVMQPQLVFALILCDQVYGSMGYNEMWITSVSDTDPSRVKGSLHPVGKAADLRFPKTMVGNPLTVWKPLANALASRLGKQYDVVLEIDHIHIEFDIPPVAEDLRKPNAS